MILRLELQTGILTELVPTPSFRRTAWFFLHVFIDEHRHGDLATHCGGFIFLLPPSLKRAGVAAKCWDLCVLPSSCCLCMTSCGFQHLVLNLPMKASSYSLTILPDWNCPEKWYLRDRCEVSPEPITHCSSPSQESCFRQQTLDETGDHYSLDSGHQVYRRN